MSGETASRPAAAMDDLDTLMREYQAGSGDAAAALVERMSPQIFQYFLAQARDRARAEDLLQDFWLRIHKARRTYRVDEPVLPWMYAIARRVQIDDYRRRSRITRHEFQTEALPEPTQARTPHDLGYGLFDLLKTLPEQQRETVLLLKVGGLTLEEVARAKGASVGAIKQRAHRAFETLRRAFGDKT